MKTDRLTSACSTFPAARPSLPAARNWFPTSASTSLARAGASRSRFPSTRLPTAPCRLFIDDDGDMFGGGIATETFPVCDQYTLQGDAFSRAVLEGTEVPVPSKTPSTTWR